jgi:soluble lytic murein transglycosylase-like protein
MDQLLLNTTYCIILMLTYNMYCHILFFKKLFLVLIFFKKASKESVLPKKEQFYKMDDDLPLPQLVQNLLRLFLMLVVITGVAVITLREKQKHIPAADKTIVTVKSKDAPSSAKELLKTRPGFSPASVSGKKKERLFHPIILQAANRYQVDPALVNAIIMAESGYNPKAVSKKGARGLMQLMPGTAEALGVKDSFNPEQNIDGGVRYFKQLVNQFNGDIKLALAAYNAGSRNVRLYQGIPPFKATQFYIKKVFKYYHIYKSQPAERLDRA